MSTPLPLRASLAVFAMLPMLAYAAPIRVAVEQGAVATSGNGGAAATAAQLNDDTYYDFTATVVTAAQIDSAAELANYDVVIFGDTGNNNDDWTAAMASALVAFVSGGGGVVTAGWVDYSITSGTVGGADLDEVIPIDAFPDSTNYFCYGSQTMNLSSTSHDVTSGLPSSFVTTAADTEISPLPVDSGATILGTSGGTCTASPTTALVVDDYGGGRTVYIGLLYMAQSGYSTTNLRSGNADRLLEQAVNWASFGIGSCTDADLDGYTDLACGGDDCDDTDATINPGEAELCDGVDNDCDSTTDEADATDATDWYDDADGDNFGDPGTGVTQCTAPSGYIADGTDCDDGEDDTFPGAASLDSASACMTDEDGDEYGDSTTGPGVSPGNDCDDGAPSVYPGATEAVADGIDQDCDTVDACYADDDGDNFGSPAVRDGSSLDCVSGSGSAVSTDCDDGDDTVYPGAPESTADGIDQDCDTVDTCFVDVDDDNYGISAVADGSSLDCDSGSGAAFSSDCDDNDPASYPGAPESVADGVDQDCDTVDACYFDGDGDNYGTSLVVDGSSLSCVTGTGSAVPTDCDDTSAAINPAATEIPGDNVDQDCNGGESCYVDNDRDLARSALLVSSSDSRCDASGEALASADLDCDDADPTAYPDAVELTGTGVDENCDGAELCYTDADNDDFRPDLTSTTASADADCDDAGEASNAALSGDCDDGDADFNPAAPETSCADPNDYNCDGSVSYQNVDGDAFAACEECNDRDASVFPGAPELPGDAVDSDCDGDESCYVDADDDGARSEFVVVSLDVACAGAGEALASADLDCDDADPTAYPAAIEIPGSGVDEDCDSTEICYVDDDGDAYRPDETSTLVSVDGDCDDAGEALASALPGDCDDASVDYYPGAPEEDCADPNDYNCDGSVSFSNNDGDSFAACLECDDSDASVYPGAPEQAGDGVDSDCDGFDICFVDADDDGFRPDSTSTVAGTTVACDAPGEARESEPDGDCDDLDPTVSPAAFDTAADGLDTDCDGFELCYVDDDGDGYRSDDGATVLSPNLNCDGPGEAPATASIDCDDSDDSVRPDGEELAGDELDTDCDGGEICYVDADDDGFRPDGFATMSSADLACDGPGEALATDPTTDCDDADPTISPMGTELTGDGVDSDCDTAEICFVDADDDDYVGDVSATVDSDDLDCDDTGEAWLGALDGDCNDTDAGYNPGIVENDCADPNDYNCDGSVGRTDADTDGWAACEECDDNNAAVFPGAAEAAGDGVDQDCDGSELCYVDADDDDYRLDDTTTVVSTNVACTGLGEAPGGAGLFDCDDEDATINPGASEIAGDEIDQDCDGAEDCLVDVDADGYTNDPTAVVSSEDLSCDGAGEGTAAVLPGDCDDGDPAYNPGAAEDDCTDPNDYNCDGSSGFADADGDGFAACEECDDGSGTINPEAAEICNELDDDCDGTVDVGAVDAGEWFADADADGYTDPDTSLTACDAPDGFAAATAEDCADDDPTVNPGALDVPEDGIDQDCLDGDEAGVDSMPVDTGAPSKGDKDPGGCGCDVGSGAGAGALALGVLALVRRRRRDR